MAQVVMLFSFPLTSIWLVDAGQCCYSLKNFYNWLQRQYPLIPVLPYSLSSIWPARPLNMLYAQDKEVDVALQILNKHVKKTSSGKMHACVLSHSAMSNSL